MHLGQASVDIRTNRCGLSKLAVTSEHFQTLRALKETRRTDRQDGSLQLVRSPRQPVTILPRQRCAHRCHIFGALLQKKFRQGQEQLLITIGQVQGLGKYEHRWRIHPSLIQSDAQFQPHDRGVI